MAVAHRRVVLAGHLLDLVHRLEVRHRIVDDPRKHPILDVGLQVDGVGGEDKRAGAFSMGDHPNQTRRVAREVVQVQVRGEFQVRPDHEVVVDVGKDEFALGASPGEILRSRVGDLERVGKLLVVDDDAPASGLRASEEVQAAAVVDMEVRDHDDVYVAHLQVESLELLWEVLPLVGDVGEHALQGLRPAALPVRVARAVIEDIAQLGVVR